MLTGADLSAEIEIFLSHRDVPHRAALLFVPSPARRWLPRPPRTNYSRNKREVTELVRVRFPLKLFGT